MRKVFFIAFTIIFIAFATVQFNDSDGWLWILIYLLAALMCFRAYRKEGERLSYIFLGVLYGLWAANQFPPVWEGLILDSMDMKTPNIEFARESLGLGLCAVAMVFAGIWE
jgi:Transmembrane family 220, helix